MNIGKMSNYKQGTRANQRVYNADSPDISDLVFVPNWNKHYSYYCTSAKCTNNNNNGKKVLKFDKVMLKFDSDCPHCGSSMICKKDKTKQEVEL